MAWTLSSGFILRLGNRAAEYPFPLEKSPRPFGEVMSFEFWVLSWKERESREKRDSGLAWLVDRIGTNQRNQTDQINQTNKRDGQEP